MSFKLAHISDVHLGPLPKVQWHELLSKRITGYINWQRNRATHMGSDALEEIVASLNKQSADHVAITGDVINLGLDKEVENATQWLNQNFDPMNTSLTLGNHDAYVRGALPKVLAAWKPFISSDQNSPHNGNTHFPYMRVREKLAIIGASSAIATPPFIAAGYFGKQQASHLSQMLDKAKEQGLFRVVLIHHPPVRHATSNYKRLYGIGRFQKTIEEHGAELVLHGHTHLPQRHEIKGPNKTRIPVIGVPSASQALGGKKPAAAYNLFSIDQNNDRFSCLLEQYSITDQSSKPVLTDQQKLF